MFVIVTQHQDERAPITAYAEVDHSSAVHLAQTISKYSSVLQTTVFALQADGAGAMEHVATFGHYAP